MQFTLSLQTPRRLRKISFVIAQFFFAFPNSKPYLSLVLRMNGFIHGLKK